MLRVFKVTSPMSVGSWLLSAYVPAAGVAAATALTGRLPRAGAAATAGAALLGPAVAAYTAALIADTAVPAWHDGYPEMPFVFTGSAAMAAGGLGLLAAPARQIRAGAEPGPARPGRGDGRLRADDPPHRDGRRALPRRPRRHLRENRPGTRRPWRDRGGRPGPPRCQRRPRRVLTALSGAALLGASVATRWGVFYAGLASAEDPKYTVVPQRTRLTERAAAGPAPSTSHAAPQLFSG